MLILDRTQRAWATLSAVVCVVAGGVYACYASWSANGPSGGSVLGLIFGSIAAAMMVFAGLLAARRRFPAARVGSAQFWMKGHLWIGTLTVPFALFHAGFGLGGRVEILLWILFFAVILSGFWGLLLQQLLPRMMFENLPRETFIEQIPHLCIRFTAESDRLLSEVCGPLEVTLTPGEVKQFEPHLRPHFRDHIGKNRSLYPNTESDTVHFQKFLKRIYVEIPTPATVAAEAPQPVIAQEAPPAMKSVAQIKAPEQPIATPPAAMPTVASAAEAPALKPKPDPKALLAAAKAKSAGAVPPETAAATPEVAPAGNSPPPTAQPAAQTKPDPRAMLAAAKAKQAQAAAAANPDANLAPTPIPPVNPDAASPAKPDPKTLLAAARAKKAAAEAAEAPAVPEPVAGPVDVPVAAVAAKPDPKAMLAAAKAKRDAVAARMEPTAPTAEPSSIAEPAPPNVPPPAPSGKPDPKAMLAAAKAKRDAAAAAGTEPTPTPSPTAAAAPASAPAPAGKPDAKAMLAAMKAKKEAAAQQAGSAAASVEPTPAPQANPLGPLKTVKQPAAAPQSDLVGAANLAPPTAAQVKELKLFYLELIRPHLPMQPATQAWREGIRRSIMVRQIRSDNQHPQFIPIFDQLLDLCEQRRQFAMIQRYHFWLHGWLLVHIPATVALYLVLVVHAVVALRVVPFGN